MSNFKIVDSIVKKAEDKTSPKQYSYENTTTSDQLDGDDEEMNNMPVIDYLIDNQESLQVLDKIRANNAQFHVLFLQWKENLQYIALLSMFKQKPFNIIDEVDDTYIFGSSWIPLFEEGILKKRVDIIGFDDNAKIK